MGRVGGKSVARSPKTVISGWLEIAPDVCALEMKRGSVYVIQSAEPLTANTVTELTTGDQP